MKRRAIWSAAIVGDFFATDPLKHASNSLSHRAIYYTDENQRVASQFNVMSIPTMILFKDGQPVKQIIGAKPKPALMRDLAPYLG